MLTWPRRPFRSAKRGQSLVEFALIAPLLVAILFGIIELGILLGIYVGLTNSAREAARAGAIYQESSAVTDDATKAAMDSRRLAFIAATITDTLNPMIDKTRNFTVTVVYSPTSTVDIGSSSGPSPTFVNYYRAGDIVNVRILYTHELFFGLLKRRSITLDANSSMRIEPGGVR